MVSHHHFPSPKKWEAWRKAQEKSEAVEGDNKTARTQMKDEGGGEADKAL